MSVLGEPGITAEDRRSIAMSLADCGGTFRDAARTILVITAHPDDEILIAPLLANRCIRGGASCSILVMTTGNAAGLGEIRVGEMTRAAALLNLRLTQWTYSDILDDAGAA